MYIKLEVNKKKLEKQAVNSYAALIKATDELEWFLNENITAILSKPVRLTDETGNLENEIDTWKRYKAAYGELRTYTEAMDKVWSELKLVRDGTATLYITCDHGLCSEGNKKHFRRKDCENAAKRGESSPCSRCNPAGELPYCIANEELIRRGQKMLIKNEEVDKRIRTTYEQFHKELPTSYIAKKK